MRFLLLTQYYPPEPGAASLRLEAMAHELMLKGHTVNVVSARAHHLGAHQNRMDSSRDVVRGVPVLRTWIWRVSTGRFWLRLLNYFSFVVTGFWGMLRSPRPDYVIVESPPLFLGLAAYWYKQIFKIPYILSVSDLWPESAVALGLVRNPLLIRATQGLERMLYRHAAFISGVTEGICQTIRDTGVIPAHRVLFFPNGVDTQLFHRVSPSKELVSHLDVHDKKVFLYPGTLGYAQGLEIIIDAAEVLRDRDDVVFVLVGEGPMRKTLEAEVVRRQLANVRFEPLQPVQRMAAYFSLARAVVVPLRRHPLFRGARPSKVFPAWAVRCPVIFAGEGEMADLVEKSGGGVVVPPEDAGGLAMAVEFLANITDWEWEHMGRQGYQFVMDHYTWPRIADQWLLGLEAGG